MSEKAKGSGLKGLCYRLLRSRAVRRIVNPGFGNSNRVSNGRICLVLSEANRLGDLVLHNFLVQQLEVWGYSVVYGVSASFYKQYSDFFRNHCLASRVLVVPSGGKGKGWLSFIRQAKKEKIRGVIVDYYPMVNPLLFYLAGVPVILGPEGTNTSFCSRVYQLDKANTHYTQLVNSILQLLEPDIERTNKHTIRPFFPFQQVMLPQLGKSASRYIAVHMGGSSHWNRKWPLEKFLLLCQSYLENDDGKLIFVGGKEELVTCESAKDLLESRCNAKGRIVNCCGTDLNTTAAVLSRIDLFVGNDSGPMHIANALNKRVVVIYGPSAYAAVNPKEYDRRNITIRLKMECIPCLDRDCRLPANRKLSCLNDLDVDTVWTKMQLVMSRSPDTVIQ